MLCRNPLLFQPPTLPSLLLYLAPLLNLQQVPVQNQPKEQHLYQLLPGLHSDVLDALKALKPNSIEAEDTLHAIHTGLHRIWRLDHHEQLSLLYKVFQHQWLRTRIQCIDAGGSQCATLICVPSYLLYNMVCYMTVPGLYACVNCSVSVITVSLVSLGWSLNIIIMNNVGPFQKDQLKSPCFIVKPKSVGILATASKSSHHFHLLAGPMAHVTLGLLQNSKWVHMGCYEVLAS